MGDRSTLRYRTAQFPDRYRCWTDKLWHRPHLVGWRLWQRRCHAAELDGNLLLSPRAPPNGDGDSYADGFFQSNRYPGAKPDSNSNCNTYCYSNA
jgi:hypothetical protein